MERSIDSHSEPSKSNRLYETLQLPSFRGETEGRFYEAKPSTQAILWMGGIGGGWDTPAQDLYPLLSRRLLSNQISSLRLRFRYPGQTEECVSDALAAVDFLSAQGHHEIIIAGHSFGGAVAVATAYLRESVTGLILLATQAYGAETVGQVEQHLNLLVVHGEKDGVLAPANSERVFARAREPKELHLFPEDGHNLDESAAQIHQLVHEWTLKVFHKNQ